jgi:hypothetical protein
MYLDEIAEQVGESSTSYWPLTTMIKNNRASQILRSQGYSIVAVSSGFGPSEIKEADIYMAPSGWRPTEFQNILMESTPLVFLRKTQDGVQRELVLYTFDHLADVAEIDSQTFVFTHIVSPHVPFVFGANGERIQSKSPFDYEYDEFVELYGNQLKFVTKKVQDTIDEILAKSPTPPIIILQSDHGSNSHFYAGEDITSRLPEHFAILSAYYFPDQDYEALSEDITPVNTFRVVFNQYFGTDYELLENQSYFSRIWDSPYLFSDVTDQVVDHK